MKIPTENPDSMYRNISWEDARGKTKAYQLGQKLHPSRVNGTTQDATVYSIDLIEYKVTDTSFFIRKFVISLITDRGETFEWLSTENPSNLTYLHNHTRYIQI